MQVTTVLALLVLQCTRCLTIRVPLDWTDDSEVNKSDQVLNTDNDEETTSEATYKDYFQYTAQKPQFAIEVAADHGVKSPENLYKAYPVRPHTNLDIPVLGQHHILDPKKNKYHPYQKFVPKAEAASFITPASTSFEVYHPYKAEEPYLKQIYKDPVLKNIRNDLRDSKNRLQHYEHDAGQSDVRNSEYLESPQEIDRKNRPQKNVPTQFEIHRSHRRPIYYRPPIRNHHREHFLNNKLRSPWQTNTAKITPAHYRPIKHHLQGLRQQHAIKFDDERHEYPQKLPPEDFDEKPNGYDIYEKGKSKYSQIKNNVGEFINNDDNKNKYLINQNQEPYTSDDSSSYEEDEEEFVPIKNYAQVRKTETIRHLPKAAAIHDAESLEDIENAPRLREAIKSTKAQTVYSEEGYEDGAYDHAGEQKHASDHEGHGGYLKENQISVGKYKAPSLSSSNGEAKASVYRDEVVDGKKWTDSKKETDDEAESDDYTEAEEEHLDDIYNDHVNEYDENDRYKRNDQTNSSNIENITTEKSGLSKKSPSQAQEAKDNIDKNFLEHDVIKRETSLPIPEISSTIQVEHLKKKPNLIKTNVNNIQFKYPYYYKKSKTLNKNSPIRYAENSLLMPKKTKGGTEFYDSRAYLECPEVVREIDPISDKLKKGRHPDDSEENIKDEIDSDSENIENKERLAGLGDKIDCFKAKYFGENPLDSPFFREDKIENPEPVMLQNFTDIFHVLEKINKKNDNFAKQQEHRNKSNLTMIYPTDDITQLPRKRDKLQNVEADFNLASLYRKKRAAPFIYEPYKIIKDSQIQDSKKTTTSGNISPLIKQLQSSRIIDHVSSNQDRNTTDKKNPNTKLYKDISKGDRQKYSNAQNDSSQLSFLDVNTKKSRGETRFEIKPTNHKLSYSPVDNKRTMSIKDYEMRTNGHNKQNLETHTQVKPVNRYYFDVSQYLPQNLETQNIAASTVVRKVIRTTTSSPSKDIIKKHPLVHTESEEYDEYEDDDDEEQETNNKKDITSTSTSTTTTTTSTRKPVLRKRIRGTTTTIKAEVDDVTELPKLRLVTRFNSPKSRDDIDNKEKSHKKISLEDENSYQDHSPKYTEMKKKSRTRTLVTDTKVYGDENEDKDNEEVDKLIGVKQDMNDYLPLYEKNAQNGNHKNSIIRKKADHDSSDENTHGDDTDDENKNRKEHVVEDESDEEEEDEDNEEDDDDENDDDEIDDEDDSEEKDEDDDADNDNSKRREVADDDNKDITFRNEDTKYQLQVTTSEPTKRTLARTTELPITTTAPHRGNNKSRPFQIKKKIEVHKEIPINKSSPNVTQFKQDIKEIEMVRKTPSKTNKKVNKNLEALELYRDDNLAKDINRLGGVEIFKENLNLNSEPRHGGNYRSINDKIHETKTQVSKPTQDVETSESIKQLKSGRQISRRGKNKPYRQDSYMNDDEMRSRKNIESRDSESSSSKHIHGGNPRSSSRRENENAKFVELVEDQEHEEIDPDMHGGNFNSFGSRHQTSRGHNLHGGNYRSARIVEADKTQVKPVPKEDTAKAAEFLEGYARAVPILTTTPVYILDPSKRMYYYVDA